MLTLLQRHALAARIGQREFDAQQTHQVVSNPRMVYWSWGVSKKEMHRGTCLMYKVNGRLHKGWIAVTLGWSDLYDVHVVNRHGEILETRTDLYFDQLNEVMDTMIETPLNEPINPSHD
jgi:hypothetical protein